jgi:hypothetical protein
VPHLESFWQIKAKYLWWPGIHCYARFFEICKVTFLLWLHFLFQVDAKFLRNQRFAKKHNLKPEEQKKRAEQRKASKAETV